MVRRLVFRMRTDEGLTDVLKKAMFVSEEMFPDWQEFTKQ